MQRIKDVLSPTPSTAIVQIWQGKVEIVLRCAAILLCFVVFVCAAVTSSRTSFPLTPVNGNQTITDILSLRDSTHGLAGWVIFGSIAAVIYEGVVIALRFLNLETVDQYIGIFLLTDIVVHVLFSLSVFIEGIVFAVFGGTHWVTLQFSTPLVDSPGIQSACNATAAFLLISLPLYITLSVWIGVWLFAKWQQLVTRFLRQLSGPTDEDTEDLDPSQEDF